MYKVVVAMSGGVDSSVAAALLKQQGFEVTGVMLRLWSEPGKEDKNRCCTDRSMNLARRVAAILGIPFYVLDAKDEFRDTVVQYFIDGYTRGVTPNPCLVCNNQIRWGLLLNHALALGAEYLATGHYARLKQIEDRMILLKAVDHQKDQSYVLYMLTQAKLHRTLFPLGEFSKLEVRQMAADFKLPTAARADSQDLCFLAGEDYREFIRRNIQGGGKPGQIVDRQGRVIGQHRGLFNYTIGQRKGLGLASAAPLYVLAKEVDSNTLIVGSRAELGTSPLKTTEVNWISGKPVGGAFRSEVKVRYTAKEAWAMVTPLDVDMAEVCFEVPQRDITPGQAAVFYDGDTVVGGGLVV